MGRSLRISGPGAIHHIISRCNNEEFLFKNERDFLMYLNMIYKHKKVFDFKLFHYQLMHNHIHLQVEVGERGSISDVVHSINGEFARWYNDTHRRKGHFWQERFKSTLIDNEIYFLRCGIYIELNAVRAGLVDMPQQWKYSSVHVYIEGRENKLVDISPFYLSLGRDKEERRKEYKRIFFSEFERTKAIQDALVKEDKKEIRKLLRITSAKPVPFRKDITKLFRRGIKYIINP